LTTLPESRPDVAAFGPSNALISEVLDELKSYTVSRDVEMRGGAEGIHRELGGWLAPVNQFIIVRAGSEMALPMLRAEVNGGMV
jgi:hypothetical protein